MTPDRIERLLGKMTLDEKILQLVQLSGSVFLEDVQDIQTGPLAQMGMREEDAAHVGSVLNTHGAKNTAEIQRRYLDKNRHQIPLLFMADVPNGYKTAFPIPLAQGCMWEPEMVGSIFRLVAEECKAAGIHVNLAPMTDLVRDARWGRVIESTGGEDPYLGALYAAEAIRGLQGEHLEPGNKVASCVKHFAAYGAAEAGREYNTVDLSERELRQYYLPPYRAAVQAGAALVMTSFNTVMGVPASGNKRLLYDLLREEWGYDGVVISDYASIKELTTHGVAADDTEAAYLAMDAGVDIDMMSDTYVKNLKKLVETDRISETQIEDAARRVLLLKNKLGLFEDPYWDVSETREKKVFCCQRHLSMARRSAAESFVLLKNENNLLPLAVSQKIALVGPYGDCRQICGGWNFFADMNKVVTLRAGMAKRAGKLMVSEGCQMLRMQQANPILAAYGKQLIDMSPEEERRRERALLRGAVETVRQADVVVLALGESYLQSGEGGSRTDLGLPEQQLTLLEALHNLGKPLVVVIFCGHPVQIAPVAEKADALLIVWFPGTEGGNAIADVMYGDVNPSGKLVMSFPQNAGQCPVYYNHYNTGRPHIRDIRFASRYLNIPAEPYYPFGYGLSYARFAYSDLSLSSDTMEMDGTITAWVTVRNESDIPGTEIVQLYIRDVAASVVRPVKELKGFQKLRFAPGEEKLIRFAIMTDMLAFVDADLNTVCEPGEFRVYIGGNSVDCLDGTFVLKKSDV